MRDPLRRYCDRIVVVANSRNPRLLSRLRDAAPRDMLVLSDVGTSARGADGCYHAPYHSSAGVWRSNANAAILIGTAALALRQRRYVQAFRHIAIGSLTGWLCALPILLYYGARGELKLAGIAAYRPFPWLCLPLLLFESCFKTKWQSSSRLFASPEKTPLETLRSLADVDYAVLRWADRIERGDPISDIDILVADKDVEKLRAILSRSLGVLAVDVRSESGARGHSGAPYFPPAIARRLLASSVVRNSGVKTLGDEAAYLATTYHLLFHKSISTPSGSERLSSSTWGEARHYENLMGLAQLACRREPQTFSDMEADLKEAGMFPPLDTIGIYSARIPFIKDRYTREQSVRPGLSVFLVRNAGAGPQAVPRIRQLLTGEAFHIIAEGPMDEVTHRTAIDTIRGGNWADKHAKKMRALPIHYFICHNDAPKPLSRSTRRRRPRLDDEHLLVKDRIREALGTETGGLAASMLHCSDNSAEAMEYVYALGMSEHPAVSAVLAYVRGEATI